MRQLRWLCVPEIVKWLLFLNSSRGVLFHIHYPQKNHGHSSHHPAEKCRSCHHPAGSKPHLHMPRFNRKSQNPTNTLIDAISQTSCPWECRLKLMEEIHDIPQFNKRSWLRTLIRSMFNTRWLDVEFELTLLFCFYNSCQRFIHRFFVVFPLRARL